MRLLLYWFLTFKRKKRSQNVVAVNKKRNLTESFWEFNHIRDFSIGMIQFNDEKTAGKQCYRIIKKYISTVERFYWQVMLSFLLLSFNCVSIERHQNSKVLSITGISNSAWLNTKNKLKFCIAEFFMWEIRLWLNSD